MSSPEEGPPGLLEELKRRRVVRAAALYGAAAFAVLQGAEIVVEPLGLPPGTMRVLVRLALIGLPITLVASWFLDVSSSDPGAGRWFSRRTAVAVPALLAIGLGAGWAFRSGGGEAPDSSDATEASAPAVATDPDAVVVLPFTVAGPADAGYLADAVPRLLTSSLDGTAGLRAVSSHALMGFPGLTEDAPVSEDLARRVASHFGAGVWILGDVVTVGDSLRIAATLVDPRRSGPLAAEVTTAQDELFTAVDRLAALLVAERETDAGSARTRAAARTASSPTALRAYVEGERAFRTGSYLPAVDAFTRAIQADSTFALAFYRLSMAEERLAWAEASRRSAEAAWRHARNLSPRESEFLEAVVALRRGETSRAEQMLRAHVRAHPDDPEAWYQLGEILFHGEPLRGGSMTAAREPLERALFFDPADLGALYHLVRIAVKEGDAARVDSLSARFVALSQGERTLELRALQAVSSADLGAFEGILDEMRASPDPFLPIAVWSVGVFGGDPEAAASIATLMTGSDRPVEVRGAGHVMLAHLALAGGRLSDARAELDAAEALGDPDAAEFRAWFAALPFVPATDGDVLALRSTLGPDDAGPRDSPRPSSFFSAQNGVHPLVRSYLRGLLSARLGDADGVAAARERLAAVDGPDADRRLAVQLSAGIAARQTFERGDAAEGGLSEPAVEGWYELTFVSPYYAAALERFLHAEELRAAGRVEEALRWYEGLRENTVAELVFAGPALLREAGLHRAAGRTREAAAREARFEALWRHADPGYRDAVRARFGQD